MGRDANAGYEDLPVNPYPVPELRLEGREGYPFRAPLAHIQRLQAAVRPPEPKRYKISRRVP